jgi:signal transduction histidine kinase
MTRSLDLAVELAHDVRSPLGAIMALSELVETGATGPVNDTQRRLMRVMREAAAGLSSMTSDIVSAGHARIREGAEATSVFEIQDVLDTVKTVVQPMAEHAGVNVVVSNGAPRRWVGRRIALTRVLLNLTTNALKYTARGVVEYGVRQLSPYRLQFFVRDTGGGIVKPGTAASTSNLPQWKRARSGLGLAMTRALLGGMGSTLQLESTPGEGCCFRFELTADAATAARRILK